MQCRDGSSTHGTALDTSGSDAWTAGFSRFAHKRGSAVEAAMGDRDLFRRFGTLYHFTDTRNLPSIREQGGILSTTLLRERQVEFFAGGDEASLALDERQGLNRYVRLCFAERHPMAHHVLRRNPETTLMYIQINRAIVYEPGVMFSKGVAYAAGVEIVPLSEAVERGLVDFDVLYSFMPWVDPVIQQRRRAAELCEILVPDQVALAFIRNMPNG